jgi:hypothetical protein
MTNFGRASVFVIKPVKPARRSWRQWTAEVTGALCGRTVTAGILHMDGIVDCPSRRYCSTA